MTAIPALVSGARGRSRLVGPLAFVALLLAGVACADDSDSSDVASDCPLPADWDESIMEDVTDENGVDAVAEHRRTAMSLGDVVDSDEFRVSVARSAPEDAPPSSGTLSIDEWRELADVFVVVEDRAPGTLGVPGEDWCLSVLKSQVSYDETMDMVRRVVSPSTTAAD